jgi:formamidopyrimidine-DNA glycosylase
MPELPEVTTTVNGLNEVLPNLKIEGVWSDYFLRTANKRTDNIKNKKFFELFKKEIVGQKVKSAERRGKNILIHLTSDHTILIHMKMTGHLLYGKYDFDGKRWKSEEKLLSDPFNQFIHLVFSLSNKKHLAFSDVRKFAKVTFFQTKNRGEVLDIVNLGPEPLGGLSLSDFQKQLFKKPNGKIKTVLMDQSIIAGIGNIYSDEILWQAGVHPERVVKKILESEMKKIWRAMSEILLKSISLGGDSMSDYRNIFGERGSFQKTHKVYRRKGEKCSKKGCSGIIMRKVVGGRSAHFCPVHQK